MNIKELREELVDLNWRIERLIKKVEFDSYDDLSGVDYNENDSDDLLLMEEYRDVMMSLEDARRTLNYLNRPIKFEGELHKQSNGRYEVCGMELTCGSYVEVLRFDEYREMYVWMPTGIEHNGEDYYFDMDRDLEVEGTKVRIR